MEQLDLIANSVLDQASGTGFPIGGIGQGRGSVGVANADLPYNRFFWGTAVGTRGEVDGSDGLGDFDYDISSLILGADVLRDPAYKVGVFGAISQSSLSEHDLIDQNIDTNSYSIGAYGRYSFANSMQLSGVLGYLIDTDHSVIVDVEATRSIRQAEVGAAQTMIDRTEEQ